MKLSVCIRNVIARQTVRERKRDRESEIDKDRGSAHIITVIKVSNKFINAVFLMITNYRAQCNGSDSGRGEADAEAVRQRCT